MLCSSPSVYSKPPVVAICCAMPGIERQKSPTGPAWLTAATHGSGTVSNVWLGPANSSPMLGARVATEYTARKRMSSIGAQVVPAFQLSTVPTVE